MNQQVRLNQANPRLSSYALGNGIVAKNRIVVPPMASGTADALGCATDSTVAHYERLAKSGAGLVFAEYSFVHHSGKSEEHQLGVHDDRCTPGLAKIARTIKKQRAIAGLQITHAGGKAKSPITKYPLQGPSAIAVPTLKTVLEVPEAMSLTQIETWKHAFLNAALRAKDADFDMIEFHCAHGYGLNQWLSPITNQRTDRYGGPLENRARLLLEIVASIQAAAPSLLLSARIPGKDFLDGGLDESQIKQLVRLLEVAGISILNVSSGIGGWGGPRDRVGEGFLVPEAAVLQRATTLPVIGVGGIETGAYADKVILQGDVSFVAVGRAILENRMGDLFTPNEQNLLQAES